MGDPVVTRVWLVALVGACFQPPDFGGSSLSCADSQTCPDGFSCVEDRCVREAGSATFVHFEATELTRGCEADGEATCPGDASPNGHVQSIALGSFDLQLAEVTQAEYDACVTSLGCTAPEIPDYAPRDTPDLPVRGVTWQDARRYCAAQTFRDGDGETHVGRLPTEAEWECAAGLCNAGTAYPWPYPWGVAAPTCALANMPGCSGHVEPASDAGKTARGLRDLAGNLREWVQDVYANPYGNDAENPCNGCNDLGASPRVTRGGSFRQEPSKLRVWARWSEDLTHRDDATIGDVGFRCAADTVDSLLPR